MSILEHLNKLATEFSPLIQLLMLFAVSAATITALWSTWRSRKDKQIQIEYECKISSILIPTAIPGENEAQYNKSHESVTAMLTNTGLRPTNIPWLSFGLIIPYAKNNALLNPVTDYRANAPLPLNPGKQVSLELRSPDQLREEILGFDIQWFPRLRIRRLRLTFVTEGGEVFSAKIGKVLRAHIKETAAQTSWIYDNKHALEQRKAPMGDELAE